MCRTQLCEVIKEQTVVTQFNIWWNWKCTQPEGVIYKVARYHGGCNVAPFSTRTWANNDWITYEEAWHQLIQDFSASPSNFRRIHHVNTTYCILGKYKYLIPNKTYIILHRLQAVPFTKFNLFFHSFSSNGSKQKCYWNGETRTNNQGTCTTNWSTMLDVNYVLIIDEGQSAKSIVTANLLCPYLRFVG